MFESTGGVFETITTVTSVSETVEAVTHAPETISNLFEWGGKLFYGIGYAAAFVFVFPAALIGAAIPQGNALVRGVLAGSAAAQEKAQGWLG
jgi:hypothetical protein